ncbi:hypothetical protein DY000_02040967 [Brassica cretica]|uniref:Uncharacterized protein n=1 Tax=Brassica cretica TaxID=69181 RepID=A0ABQ7B7U7_BRACR|nr:hypothetical protein DY000_02040967 [Brassica cretica]
MEGSPYRNISISPRGGTGREGQTWSASQQGPGASPSGVMPGVWRNSIPEYFSQQFAPYFLISSSNSRNNLCTPLNRNPPYTSTMKPKSDLTLDSSSIRVVLLLKLLHPEGPLLTIGVEEVSNWREKYHLSNDITIRIPGPVYRVSDFEIKEIPVYEGFFESGFRDRVPSLVAKVSEALEISLGRYHLHPSGMELPVQEISKKERKRHPVFDGRWADKFAFMHLPEFSSAWRTAGGCACVDSSLGKRMTERALKLPIETSGPFSCEQRSTGTNQRRGSTGRVQESFKVMSEKKAARKRAAPSENDDEVQFIKCSKRQAMTAPASSSKKKSKASGSTPKVSPS